MTLTPLDESETELTNKYDISQSEIETVKENTEKVVTALFDDSSVEADADVIELIQQRLLSNELLVLNEYEWPPTEDKLTTDETPEEHFKTLYDKMETGGEEAKNQISFIIGTLTNDVNMNHPIYEYAKTRINKKHNQAKQNNTK